MNSSQRAFSAGEIAPAFFGRADTVRYAHGLRTCRNVLVNKTGGLSNRAGTEFLCGLGDLAARIIPWVFDDDQTYLLVVQQNDLRIWKQRSTVPSSFLFDFVDTTSLWTEAELPYIRFVQAADRMTLVHPNHPPYELIRNDDDDWTFQAVQFGVGITPPDDVVTNDPGTVFYYVVTALSETEESLPSASAGADDGMGAGNQAVEFTMTTGGRYRIYRSDTGEFGTYGFIREFDVIGAASPSPTTVQDQVPGGGAHLPADLSQTPPVDRNPFASVYPAAVAHYQQREVYANLSTSPETVYASRTALHDNFLISHPLQDDDAVTFTLQGHRINTVLDMIDLGRLVVFTRTGAWVIEGDAAGILLPGQVNPRQLSYYGISNRVAAVPVGPAALYLQQRGGQIRLIQPNSVAGVTGADLSLPSAHLFQGYSIVAMAYQETPQSILWCVRSDGVLLGMTYVEEEQSWGWHRHDTDGFIEDVCVLPGEHEDIVYLTVVRAIEGNDAFRTLERIRTRTLFTEDAPTPDADNGCFMDDSVAFDGRDPWDGAKTITLSGGTTWAAGEEVSITASDEIFIEADAGSASLGFVREGEVIVLHGSDGAEARVLLLDADDAFPDRGTVQALTAIPASLRNTGVTNWDQGRTAITGLDHLEGLEVSVLADGAVVSSPNNPSIDTLTVQDGAITLATPAVRVRVGLPYFSDVETLDIENPSGASLKPNKMLVNQVGLSLAESRGIFVGPSITDENTMDAGFKELPAPRTAPGNVPELRTEYVSIPIPNAWGSHGRIAIRQVDPLPMTILAIHPQGAP